MDWLPTFLAIAGEPDIVEKCKKGYTAGKKTFKVHLDGYNLLPYLTGQETKSPRISYFYFSDDGDLTAIRYDHWKLVFMEQRVQGTLADLGGTLCAPAGAQDLQPAYRPLRAGGHYFEHLL